MNAKLPRYTLHFDNEHPYQAIFIRDDAPVAKSSSVPSLKPDPLIRRIGLDFLLAVTLSTLAVFAFSNHPGLWPGWLQSMLGGGFALGAGYLAVKYYSLLIALYLLTISMAIAASVIGFFWWII
ncbi:hypothetical protein [Aliamphritea ceti]|uniref:hypothetical protein n=1 Tax=Aliamphritea ceti TaxID=1524258 RepID=UPI0021C4BBD0|nr:hypothetical protein [Aliamphritea ceti]